MKPKSAEKEAPPLCSCGHAKDFHRGACRVDDCDCEGYRVDPPSLPLFGEP